MKEPPIILGEEAREAVHAARDAEQAKQLAQQAFIQEAADNAARVATELATKRMSERMVDEDRMAAVVRKQMMDILSSGSDKERAIVLARVPYICQEIEQINTRGQRIEDALVALNKILSNYPLVEKAVFGFIAMIVIAVVGAMIALVVIHR